MSLEKFENKQFPQFDNGLLKRKEEKKTTKNASTTKVKKKSQLNAEDYLTLYNYWYITLSCYTNSSVKQKSTL